MDLDKVWDDALNPPERTLLELQIKVAEAQLDFWRTATEQIAATAAAIRGALPQLKTIEETTARMRAAAEAIIAANTEALRTKQ